MAVSTALHRIAASSHVAVLVTNHTSGLQNPPPLPALCCRSNNSLIRA